MLLGLFRQLNRGLLHLLLLVLKKLQLLKLPLIAPLLLINNKMLKNEVLLLLVFAKGNLRLTFPYKTSTFFTISNLKIIKIILKQNLIFLYNNTVSIIILVNLNFLVNLFDFFLDQSEGLEIRALFKLVAFRLGNFHLIL